LPILSTNAKYLSSATAGEKESEAKMSENKPVNVMALYRLKKGTEAQFKPLLAKHWPILEQAGLVTKEKPEIWKALDKRNPEKLTYFETFQWKNEKAPEIAHQTPEVMKVWEPMGPLLESLEILHLEPTDL
jgi:hypothetical protein